MKKLSFVLFFICSTILSTNAQDWNWGDDIVTAKGNWAYFRNLVNAKKYEDASVKIPWFLEHTPDLNENLYVYSSQVYEARVSSETDPEKVEVLKDSALLLYDMRLEYYPDNKANIYNRKGLVAWNYLSKKPEKTVELYEFYSAIYELNGDNMYIPNATAWMFSAALAKQRGKLTDDDLWEVYGTLTDFIDGQKEKLADNPTAMASLEQNADLINRRFLSAVDFSCDDFEAKLGDKFRASKDLKMAKRIQNMMFKNKCTSSPLFKEVLSFVLENEPNAEGHKYMAYILTDEKDYQGAIEEYEKAIALSTSDNQKAPIYLEMGRLYYYQGKKASARASALKSINAGGDKKAAYTFIGDLYYSSFDQCTDDNILVSRAVFIAAYNMYEKAGNSAKMADAKQQFPSMEEIHQRNKSLGDPITIECWINETVSLQRR